MKSWRVPGARNRADFWTTTGLASGTRTMTTGRYRNGRGGVQHDAKGTVVGIGASWMDVRDLTERQQHQQDQAEHAVATANARDPARLCSGMWLECNQALGTLSYQDTQVFDACAWLDAIGNRRGTRNLANPRRGGTV